MYWGLRIMLGIYSRGGRWLFQLLLYPVVLYYFILVPGARRASLDYLHRLQHSYPEIEVRPTLWWSYRHFVSFATTMLDKLAAWRHGVGNIPLEFPNRSLLLDQLATGRGAVLMTAHVGNLEMCRALADQRAPVRLTVLVHTRHAANFNRLLARYEHSSKIKLLQVNELTPATAVVLEQRIAQGELIVIAADRVPVASRHAQRVPFLGAEAAFPQGPFILAGLLRAPVFTLFCTRRGRGYHMDVAQLTGPLKLPRSQRREVLEPIIREFSRRLEVAVCQAPLQWFNFYNFWTAM